MLGSLMIRQLNELRLKNVQCDLELVSSDNVSFNIHQIVFTALNRKHFDLAVQQAFIYSSDMRILSKKKMYLSHLTSIELELLIEFMYGGTVTKKRKYDILLSALGQLDMIYLLDEVGGFTFDNDSPIKTETNVQEVSVTSASQDVGSPELINETPTLGTINTDTVKDCLSSSEENVHLSPVKLSTVKTEPETPEPVSSTVEQSPCDPVSNSAPNVPSNEESDKSRKRLFSVSDRINESLLNDLKEEIACDSETAENSFSMDEIEKVYQKVMHRLDDSVMSEGQVDRENEQSCSELNAKCKTTTLCAASTSTSVEASDGIDTVIPMSVCLSKTEPSVEGNTCTDLVILPDLDNIDFETETSNITNESVTVIPENASVQTSSQSASSSQANDTDEILATQSLTYLTTHALLDKFKPAVASVQSNSDVTNQSISVKDNAKASCVENNKREKCPIERNNEENEIVTEQLSDVVYINELKNGTEDQCNVKDKSKQVITKECGNGVIDDEPCSENQSTSKLDCVPKLVILEDHCVDKCVNKKPMPVKGDDLVGEPSDKLSGELTSEHSDEHSQTVTQQMKSHRLSGASKQGGTMCANQYNTNNNEIKAYFCMGNATYIPTTTILNIPSSTVLTVGSNKYMELRSKSKVGGPSCNKNVKKSSIKRTKGTPPKHTSSAISDIHVTRTSPSTILSNCVVVLSDHYKQPIVSQTEIPCSAGSIVNGKKTKVTTELKKSNRKPLFKNSSKKSRKSSELQANTDKLNCSSENEIYSQMKVLDFEKVDGTIPSDLAECQVLTENATAFLKESIQNTGTCSTSHIPLDKSQADEEISVIGDVGSVDTIKKGTGNLKPQYGKHIGIKGDSNKRKSAGACKFRTKSPDDVEGTVNEFCVIDDELEIETRASVSLNEKTHRNIQLNFLSQEETPIKSFSGECIIPVSEVLSLTPEQLVQNYQIKVEKLRKNCFVIDNSPKTSENDLSVSAKTSENDRSASAKKTSENVRSASAKKTSENVRSVSAKTLSTNDLSASAKTVSENDTSASDKMTSENVRSVSAKKRSENDKSVFAKTKSGNDRIASAKKTSENNKSLSTKTTSENDCWSLSTKTTSENDSLSLSAKKTSENDGWSLSAKKTSENDRSASVKTTYENDRGTSVKTTSENDCWSLSTIMTPENDCWSFSAKETSENDRSASVKMTSENVWSSSAKSKSSERKHVNINTGNDKSELTTNSVTSDLVSAEPKASPVSDVIGQSSGVIWVDPKSDDLSVTVCSNDKPCKTISTSANVTPVLSIANTIFTNMNVTPIQSFGKTISSMMNMTPIHSIAKTISTNMNVSPIQSFGNHFPRSAVGQPHSILPKVPATLIRFPLRIVSHSIQTGKHVIQVEHPTISSTSISPSCSNTSHAKLPRKRWKSTPDNTSLRKRKSVHETMGFKDVLVDKEANLMESKKRKLKNCDNVDTADKSYLDSNLKSNEKYVIEIDDVDESVAIKGDIETLGEDTGKQLKRIREVQECVIVSETSIENDLDGNDTSVPELKVKLSYDSCESNSALSSERNTQKLSENVDDCEGVGSDAVQPIVVSVLSGAANSVSLSDNELIGHVSLKHESEQDAEHQVKEEPEEYNRTLDSDKDFIAHAEDGLNPSLKCEDDDLVSSTNPTGDAEDDLSPNIKCENDELVSSKHLAEDGLKVKLFTNLNKKRRQSDKEKSATSTTASDDVTASKVSLKPPSLKSCKVNLSELRKQIAARRVRQKRLSHKMVLVNGKQSNQRISRSELYCVNDLVFKSEPSNVGSRTAGIPPLTGSVQVPTIKVSKNPGNAISTYSVSHPAVANILKKPAAKTRTPYVMTPFPCASVNTAASTLMSTKTPYVISPLPRTSVDTAASIQMSTRTPYVMTPLPCASVDTAASIQMSTRTPYVMTPLPCASVDTAVSTCMSSSYTVSLIPSSQSIKYSNNNLAPLPRTPLSITGTSHSVMPCGSSNSVVLLSSTLQTFSSVSTMSVASVEAVTKSPTPVLSSMLSKQPLHQKQTYKRDSDTMKGSKPKKVRKSKKNIPDGEKTKDKVKKKRIRVSKKIESPSCDPSMYVLQPIGTPPQRVSDSNSPYRQILPKPPCVAFVMKPAFSKVNE